MILAYDFGFARDVIYRPYTGLPQWPNEPGELDWK